MIGQSFSKRSSAKKTAVLFQLFFAFILAFSLIGVQPVRSVQAADTCVTLRGSAGSDDAEERINTELTNGEVDLDGEAPNRWLQMYRAYEGSTTDLNWWGLRFLDVNLPNGATITSANITFRAAASNAAPTSMTLWGQASDNPSTFTTAVNNISDTTTRPRTTASSVWNVGGWTSGSNYSTPDLSAIVQEIVNRSGWAENNALVIVGQATVNQNRTAISLDGTLGSSLGPYLKVCYSVGQTITTTGTLLPFNSVVGTPSAEQSFAVSGANLTAPITVAAPTNFQVSLTSGSGWSTSVTTATPIAGTVASTNIFVRLNPTSVTTYGANIINSSVGATTKNVAVTGSSVPSITITGTLAAFSTPLGTPSAVQTYIVSGVNLTNAIDLSVPSGFETSLDGSVWVDPFESWISLVPTGGVVPTTTIYVRMTGADLGGFGGNIGHASSGAITKNVATTGTVYNVYALTVGNDGNGTVGLNPATSPYLSGTSITLTPVPNQGYVFDAWTGTNASDVVNTNGIFTIVMNSNKAITATFTKAPPWTAYNDMSGTSLPANTTEFTIGTTSGMLKDFDSGTDTGVTVTVTTSGTLSNQTGQGAATDSGTDAYNTFNGQVNMQGVVQYNINNAADFWMDLSFEGLDPSKTYTFVTTANRAGGAAGDPAYSTRLTRYTISGIVSATNASTTGTSMYNGDPYAVYFPTGENTANGYVARWTNIKPGSTGTFTVRAQPNDAVIQTYAFGMFMLQEQVGTTNSAPTTPVLVQPLDNATNVALSPTLEVTVTDPDADPMNVSFYGRPVSTAIPGEDFTLIAIPDTQNNSATVLNSMMQWIANNKTAQNIVFATGMGDIVNTSNNSAEYSKADTAYDYLDAGNVSYSVGPGNHDLVAGSLYNTYFGPSRFTGKSYYQGPSASGANENNYSLFTAGGMDFILINLQYNPTTAILDWADALLKANPTRRGIVEQHDILNINDTWNNQVSYTALSDNPNLFLMLCGHMHSGSDGSAYRLETRSGMNPVHILMTDFQDYNSGTNTGYLRLLRFSPADGKIYSQIYTPYGDAYLTNASNYEEFNMAYDMGGSGTAPFELIGTVNGIASGANASISWPGRSANTEYEWYAVASDGSLSTSTESSPWSFTTATGVSYNPPTNIMLTSSSIAENAGADAVVGTLSSTDPDAGNTFTYTLVSGTGDTDNASFNISGSSLRANAAFDYEAKNSYSVRIRTTDQGDLYFEKEFTITVTNVNEAPVLDAIGNKSINELAILSFKATAIDPDLPAQSLTFSLVGAPAGAAITAGGNFTWTPTAAQGPNIYTFDVCVSDGALNDCETIAVTVTEPIPTLLYIYLPLITK